MIYEHKDFFIACIPKTGSKSTSSWCIRNNLTPVTEYMFNKPVFATMRNNKERVLSGMAEDLYYRTLVIHNLDNDLPLPDNFEDLYRQCVLDWLDNPVHPIVPTQVHYANLNSYFKNLVDLNTVHWIHYKDIGIMDQLINKYMKCDTGLSPVEDEFLTFETKRPSKDILYSMMLENTCVMNWFELYVSQQYEPTYIHL